MKNFPNFENPEKIYRHYQRYSLEGKRFIKTDKQIYYGGVPLMYDAATRCLAVDSKDNHTLVYGSTGSLKSRSVVMPTIRILGKAGESMIINDTKGELYSRLSGELHQQGYDITIINLREPAVGNAWNPLYIPYKFYQEGDIDKAAEFTNDIANNLMRAETSASDPFWDYSAADLFFGLTLLLFKYAKEHGVPEGSVNIRNVIELRNTIFADSTKVKNHPLCKYGSEDELISVSLSGSVNAPNETRSSILSVFDQKMRAFTIQPTLLDMLANNNIDIGSIGQKKSAVFLITPDEKTTYHRLVSLFIKQSYESIIYSATLNQSNKVDNRINYILDEFSSLPAINDMPAMISAARSRDIRFLLIVQSKHQLKKKYREEAETIISNCANWIFLTSRELELLRELSELCGNKLNGTPNISVYDLQHLSKEQNEALVLCGRMKPALVSLLDIDKFGENPQDPLPMETAPRYARNKLDFKLDPEILQRIIFGNIEKPLSPDNPFAGPPVGSGSHSSSGSIEENDSKNVPIASDFQPASFDIDHLIRQIDNELDRLEKEEKKEL